jgi:hypothetical protein
MPNDALAARCRAGAAGTHRFIEKIAFAASVVCGEPLSSRLWRDAAGQHHPRGDPASTPS